MIHYVVRTIARLCAYSFSICLSPTCVFEIFLSSAPSCPPAPTRKAPPPRVGPPRAPTPSVERADAPPMCLSGRGGRSSSSDSTGGGERRSIWRFPERCAHRRLRAARVSPSDNPSLKRCTGELFELWIRLFLARCGRGRHVVCVPAGRVGTLRSGRLAMSVWPSGQPASS